MPSPTTCTRSAAQEAAAKPLLGRAVDKYGFTPNLLSVMAEAPALLEGFMSVDAIFGKTKLSVIERLIILMTSSRINDCGYCMAAFTTMAQMATVPIGVSEALRKGTPLADPKHEALRRFTSAINETRGRPSEEQVNDLIAAGYTRRTVLEVILGVSLAVLPSYAARIAEPELDALYEPNRWAADMTAEQHDQHRKYAEKRYLTVDFWRGRSA